MAFHYTAPRPTEHLLLGSMLLGTVALGASPVGAPVWAWVAGLASPFWLLVAGTWLGHAALFWSFVALIAYVDKHDKPAFIARYRVQDGKRRQPPLDRALRQVLINQFFWAPMMLVLLAGALFARGWVLSAELPTLGVFLAELAGQAVSAVIVFYVSHRFLHRPWWMKKVHRVHHEFRTTTALASEYAHPVEFCVGNFGTLAVGVILIGPSLPAIWTFEALALTTILVHHSGYAVPWAPNAVPHDWHHYRYKELFGTSGVMDRIFGTAPEFQKLEDGDVR